MKNAILFHGTGGTPNHFWFPHLKSALEEQNYTVWVPQLPDTDNPDLKNWLPFALENASFDENTVLVGHSAGCPLILSILENIAVTIRQAVLVSGLIEVAKEEPEPILQQSYDWEKIKKHCQHFDFINSDNDPWGCDDTQGRKMFNALGGNLIIRHGEGHMGSDKFNQPYKKFPLVLKLIESEQK